MQSGCKQTVMATGNKREALNPAEVMILNNGLLLLWRRVGKRVEPRKNRKKFIAAVNMTTLSMTS